MVEEDYCRKCGIKLDKGNRKYVEQAGAYFCKKCAAQLEAHYKAEYNCAICDKKFAKGELKIVLPSKYFGDEPLNIEQRFICVDCYSRISNRAASKISNSAFGKENIKKEIRKGIINKTLGTINH